MALVWLRVEPHRRDLTSPGVAIRLNSKCQKIIKPCAESLRRARVRREYLVMRYHPMKPLWPAGVTVQMRYLFSAD